MEYSAERLRAEIKRLESEGRRKGLKRILDADPKHNEKALRGITSAPLEVTYGQFSDVMEHRNHDVDELVDMFSGKIDRPRDFFWACDVLPVEESRYRALRGPQRYRYPVQKRDRLLSPGASLLQRGGEEAPVM